MNFSLGLRGKVAETLFYSAFAILLRGFMQRIVIVSAVGTSLLRNFVVSSRFRDVIEKFSMHDWDRASVDDPRNAYPDGQICKAFRDEELFEKLKLFALENPVRALAEVNGVEAVLTESPLPRGAIDIILFTTQTCNSMLCAYIAKEVLKSMGYNTIEIVEVKALRNTDEFDEGLLELLDKVVERIESYMMRGYRVVISATPGFKAETAFLTVVAMLLGAPSIYIHESFKAPVTLPALPIKVDIENLSDVLKLFKESECVDKGVAVNALGERLEHYLFIQILKEKPGGEVCLRTWLSKLLKISQK
jgi:putative CRISPR-associated protein (TIGR02619 family)